MTKTIKRVIAGISAVAVLAGVAVGAWAIGINNSSVNDQISVVPEYPDVEISDIGGIEIMPDEGGEVSLLSEKISPANYSAYGVSPLADSASTITVKNPLADVVYTWSVSMTGDTATTYVSLSATTGNSVVVSALKSFSKQITLKCDAMFNGKSYASANCTIDYKKRITGISLEGFGECTNGSDKTLDLSSRLSGTVNNALSDSGTITFNFSPVLTAGTVTPDFTTRIQVTSDGGSGNSETSESISATSIKLNDAVFKTVMKDVSSSIITKYRNGTITQMESFLYSSIAAANTYTINVVIAEGADLAFTAICDFVFKLPANLQLADYDLNLSDTNIVL